MGVWSALFLQCLLLDYRIRQVRSPMTVDILRPWGQRWGVDESDQLAALVGPLPGTWCVFAVSFIPQSPTREVQSAGRLDLGGCSEMLWGL